MFSFWFLLRGVRSLSGIAHGITVSTANKKAVRRITCVSVRRLTASSLRCRSGQWASRAAERNVMWVQVSNEIKVKKLLDEYIPSFHFSETHDTEVNAPANVVYSSALACDLSRSAIIRFLFRLRRLPRCDMTFEGLQQIGFRFLAKREGSEVVFGLIGKFWSSSAEILPFKAEDFVSFNIPGYAKAAGNILAVPVTSYRTRLITETRVWCTTYWSRARFAIYWSLIRPFSGLIRREWLRLIKQHAENTRST